jgi:hypothetical protein
LKILESTILPFQLHDKINLRHRGIIEMAPEEIKKKRKKNAPDMLQPKWMHPPDEKNPILNPEPISEERKRKEKEEWDASIKFMHYKSVNAPLKPAPPGKLLTLVGAFLTTYGFHNTSRLYTTQLASRKKLDAWEIELGVKLPEGFPDLVTIYNSWYEGYQERAQPDVKNDESKIDLNVAKSSKKKGSRTKAMEVKDEETSSSGSSDSSSDEHESDVEIKDAPPTKLERLRHSKPSPSSSSSSTSDSDGDDEKEAKSLPSSSSSASSDSDADDEKEITENKPSSKKKGTYEISTMKKKKKRKSSSGQLSSSELLRNSDPSFLVEGKSTERGKIGPGEPSKKITSKKDTSNNVTSNNVISKDTTSKDSIPTDATKKATSKNSISTDATKKATSKNSISTDATKKATSKNSIAKTITSKTQENKKPRQHTKAVSNSSSTSSSSSSSSESALDEDPVPFSKPQAVKNPSSSTESSSSSSSSASSSDVEAPPPPKDSKTTIKKSTKKTNTSKRALPTSISATDSSVTLEISSPMKLATNPIAITPILSTNAAPPSSLKRLLPTSPEDEAATQDNRSSKKPRNAAFQRIPRDTTVDPKLASNAYRFHDYGDRAHIDLSLTRGKSFTKEKNKMKRGSYRGGVIDVSGGKGIKFED